MSKETAKNRNTAADLSEIEKRIQSVSQLNDFLSVVLYGRSGTGKTTLACDFPGPALLIDVNDKGTQSVSERKGLKVLQCTDWVDLEQAYWYLKKNKKLYKTVIIDTVSMMQDLAMAHTQENSGRGANNGALLTKKDWGEVGGLMKTWLINYRDLSSFMNVVFIAQDRISRGGDEENEDTDGQIMPEVGPRLMPSVATTLNAAVSLVGNTFIRETVTRIKTAEKKIVEKRKMEYCLRIGPHAFYTTKTRKPRDIQVPAFIVDPTYEKLVDILDGE